jgi:hypothetical protein
MCGSRFRLVRFLTNALVLQEQEVANGAGVTLTPIGREARYWQQNSLGTARRPLMFVSQPLSGAGLLTTLRYASQASRTQDTSGACRPQGAT